MWGLHILIHTYALRNVCMLSCFLCVWLFATLWTVAHQALLCMGFSRQEYWSGLLFPTLGDLPHSGIQLASPVLQADSLVLSHRGSSANILICPQLINRFNEIPTKISTHFFFFSVDIDKIILKFPWGGKETRKLRYCWIRRKVGAISVPNFKIYIAAIIKTAGWHNDRHTDKWKKLEKPETAHRSWANWLLINVQT